MLEIQTEVNPVKNIQNKPKEKFIEKSLEELEDDSLNLTLNNELKKLKSLTLKTLVSIKSYRGLRRIRGLPVRGQRTHTNAKSAKKNRRF